MSAFASMVTERGTACPSYTSAGAVSSLICASVPEAVSSGSTSTRTPAAAIRFIVEADSAALPSLITVTPPLPPLGNRADARRSAPSRSLPDRSTLALTPVKAGALPAGVSTMASAPKAITPASCPCGSRSSARLTHSSACA